MDIKFIRNNPELAKQILERRHEAVSVDEILSIDEKRRQLIQARDQMRMQHKQMSEKVAELKKNKQDAGSLINDAKELSQKIKDAETQLTEIETDLENRTKYLPNFIHESVTDQDTIVAEWSKKIEFDFTPAAHWDLCEMLGILDFKAASKLSGSRFVLFKGLGAQLERALINFCLDLHTRKHGYTEIMPPVLNLAECFYTTGSLPKSSEEMYKCAEDPYYLIPTAEVPLVNLHRDETIHEDDLPKYYTAYTPCFRREAGSYGKDVRGMIRIHQFDKVELVKFTRPEDSYDEMEKLRKDVEEIMQFLGIPYRVKRLAASEMAFQSAKTYDIDAYAAGVGDWLEVSSISNCIDFQARRGNIRLRRKNGNLDYVHIMNGSGLAFSRIFIAIIENNQQKDGSVIIPEVLRPYMNGLVKIER
jgi:seryl-tRNA synthetase